MGCDITVFQELKYSRFLNADNAKKDFYKGGGRLSAAVCRGEQERASVLGSRVQTVTSSSNRAVKPQSAALLPSTLLVMVMLTDPAAAPYLAKKIIM